MNHGDNDHFTTTAFMQHFEYIDIHLYQEIITTILHVHTRLQKNLTFECTERVFGRDEF